MSTTQVPFGSDLTRSVLKKTIADTRLITTPKTVLGPSEELAPMLAGPEEALAAIKGESWCLHRPVIAAVTCCSHLLQPPAAAT